MKDLKIPTVITNSCVNKDVAVFKTTQWRELYKNKMSCKDEDILRAFWIPIEDIIALYNFYMEHTELNINAVRGYFAHDPLAPVSPDNNIDMLLVPVTQDGIDIVEMPPELGRKLGLSDGTSTIYDFTNPCPTQCDKTSPLYSDTNP